MKTEKINIRISAEEKAAIVKLALARDIPVAQIVREALRKLIEEEK